MPEEHFSNPDDWRLGPDPGRILMRHASDVITVISANGEILYESPSVERVLGFEPRELVGRNVVELLHPDDVKQGLEDLGEVVCESGVSPPLEFRWLHKDGSWRWLESVGNNLLHDPEVRGIVSVSRDITARKETEAKLRDAEERYRSLVEQIPAVTYTVAFDGTYEAGYSVEYVSPQVETLLGLPPQSFLGDAGLSYVHPEDRARVFSANEDHRKTGEPLDEEFRLLSEEGETLWVRNEARMLYSEAKGVRFSHGVLYDVTKRKAAEKALEKAHEDYRMLVEEVPGVTYVAEVATGEMLYVSPQIEEILGHPKDAHRKDPLFWRKAILEQDAALVAEAGKSGHGRRNFAVEYRMRTAAGRLLWVRDEGRIVYDEEGAPDLWRGVVLDITRRKEAEANLHESEIRFRGAFENASAGMSINDLDRRYLMVNSALCRMLGYTAQEMKSLSSPDLTHPEDLAQGSERTRQMLSGEVESVNVEKRYLRKDGSVLWAISDVFLVRDAQGEPSYFVAHVQDITARKEAERRLARSEEKYRGVVETSGEVIFQTDASGRISFVNPAWERVMGFTVEETLGKTFDAFFEERSRARLEGGVLIAGLSRGESVQEFVLLTKSGERRVFEAKVRVELDEEDIPTGSSGVLHDVTERKQLEEKLEFQALHDSLTNLPNRRLFMDRLSQALSKRDEAPVSVLFLDLDGFKSVNDRFGHEAGDSLLTEVAERVKSSLRPEDTVARLGGEEFVVLLGGVGREGAERVAGRIREKLRPSFGVGEGVAVRVTASIGATLGIPGRSEPDALLREADAAMYEAKRKGGDRHEFFEDMG